MVLSRSVAMLLVLAAFGTGACSTYHDQLARGQHAFDQNQVDRTLALLRNLEPDFTRLTLSERAQYAYLRGMSDYRIGYAADARHWLSVAKAYEDSSPGVLAADWKARSTDALAELNGVVYSQGTSALATARRPDVDEKKDDARGSSDGADVKADAPASSSSPSK